MSGIIGKFQRGAILHEVLVGALRAIHVPFHGDDITCIETPDGVLVAIKPICERLGLAANKQIARLSKDKLRWRGSLMVLPSGGGEQETYCIPLTKVAAWLASITVSRVKPEVRAALIAYQNEADEVLDRHFRLKEAEKEARIDELELQLWHAGKHLLMALPKWQRAYTLLEMGESDYMIAQRCGWSLDRERGELILMRSCGLEPVWRQDMDFRTARRAAMDRDAEQKGLFDV